jgi:hypothetical protein
MPQLTGNFGPIPSQVVLDGTGAGTVSFQPNGNNARITTLFVKVATSVKQAVVTIYKGQVSDSNIVGNTNSGSTGAPAFGNIDLFDGETLYVVWTGGDAGATATATFVGQTIPFGEVGGSELRWSDPIAAADGSLIFPAIKSPNFVTGVMGWSLDRSGNIELNSATVRGSLISGGTDGSYVLIQNNASTASIDFSPGPFTDPNVSAGLLAGEIIAAKTDNGGAGINNNAYMRFQSPSIGTPGQPLNRRPATMYMFSGTYGNPTSPAAITMGGLADSFNFYVDGAINIHDTGFPGDGVLLFDGVDAGRGRVNGVDTATSSLPIGNTETVVLTIPSMTYKAGRAYKIEFTGLVVASVGGNSPTLRTRKTNAAGQRFTNGTPYCGNTSPTTGDFRSMFTVGASNVTATLVLTIQGSATFNATMFGSATTTTALDVYDIGEASDHPNAPVLV